MITLLSLEGFIDKYNVFIMSHFTIFLAYTINNFNIHL